MDKLVTYQHILKEFLSNQAAQSIYNMPRVKSELIISEDKKHYMIIDMGWHKDEFIHELVLHFELKEHQIWLHINTTDLEIKKALTAKGVEDSDIFASFLSPLEEDREVIYQKSA